jgi:hypothetical protein
MWSNHALQRLEQFGEIAKGMWLCSVEAQAAGRGHGPCPSQLN